MQAQKLADGESESFRNLKATNYKKEAGQGQTNKAPLSWLVQVEPQLCIGCFSNTFFANMTFIQLWMINSLTPIDGHDRQFLTSFFAAW